jgi:hypothetical protein
MSEQQRAANTLAALRNSAPVPAVQPRRDVAPVQNGDYRSRYLDEIAGSGVAGRLCRFKDGEYVTSEDGAAMDTEADYLALCDQVRISWIKFNEGEAPERHGGLLYDGYQLPRREELGDLDEATWPLGLNNAPEDPWKHSLELVLQNRTTLEMFTFSTMSATGRRAVGNLLKHFDRARRTDPEYVPIIKLRTGGFKHKDPRVGFVTTPTFAVVGQSKRADAPTPSVDLDDEIPF